MRSLAWFWRNSDAPAEIEEKFGEATRQFLDATGILENTDSYERFVALNRRCRRSLLADHVAIGRQALVRASEAALVIAQETPNDMMWSARAVERLIESVDGLSAGDPLPELFTAVAASVSDEVMSRVRFGQDARQVDRVLGQLAPLVDSLTSPEIEPTTDPRRREWAVTSLARLSERYGNPAAAQARLGAALARAHAAHDVESLTELASAHYALQKRHVADKGASGWIDLITSRHQIREQADELRAHYRSRAGRLWASQIMAAMLRHLLYDDFEEGTQWPIGHMFAAIEASKARTFLDVLTCPQEPLPELEGKAALALERKLARFEPQSESLPDDARALLREVSLASLLPIGTEFDRSSRKQLLDSIERLYERHNAGFSEHAPTVPIADVQSSLQEGEVLIEYVTLPYGLTLERSSDLWIMVATQTEARVVRRQRLPRVPGEFGGTFCWKEQAPIEATPLSNLVTSTRLAIRDGDDEAADGYLKLLYRLLIEPVIDAGFAPERSARWIFVPDGPLHFVPFAALLSESGQRLIQNVPVSVVASGSVLHRLRQVPSPALTSYLAIVAPNLEYLPGFEFPDGAAEAEAIRNVFESLDGEVVTGRDANELHLRDSASGRSILHITTHGEFPEEDAVDLHHVLLAQSDGDDGRLHAEDIRRLDLRGTLLFTLEVCNGGLFRVGPGDEPYGLVPAILTAGASNGLAALWPVDHSVSRYFVAAFYSALLEQQGVPEAVQTASLAFIEDGALLREWCGFVVSGSAAPFEEDRTDESL